MAKITIRVNMVVTKLAAASSIMLWWPIMSVSAKPSTTFPICPTTMGTPSETSAR